MPNYFGIAFVGVLACVGVGLEMQRQSAQAGMSMGDYGLGGLVGSVTDKVSAMAEEKAAQAVLDAQAERWAVEPRSYLPEAPLGWSRRAFDAGDNSPVLPGGRPDSFPDNRHMEAFLQESGIVSVRPKAAAGMVLEKARTQKAKVLEQIAPRAWVYERGDEVIWLEVRYVQPVTARTKSGQMNKDIGAAFKGIKTLTGHGPVLEAPFAVVGGVPFVELRNRKGGGLPEHFRMLTGRMGLDQEVHFRVHANASRAATLEVLRAVDYELFNSLLRIPLRHIDNELLIAEEGRKLQRYAHVAGYLRQVAAGNLASASMDAYVGQGPLAGAMVGKYHQISEAWIEAYGAETSRRDMVLMRYRDSLANMAAPGALEPELINANDFLELDTPLETPSAQGDNTTAQNVAMGVAVAATAASMSDALRAEMANAQPSAPAVTPIAARPAEAALTAKPMATTPRAVPMQRVGQAPKRLKMNGRKTGCGGGSFCKVGN